MINLMQTDNLEIFVPSARFGKFYFDMNFVCLQVFLKNSTTIAPFQLTIPGCESFCSFDKVISLTKNVIPGNWNEECATNDPNYKPPPPSGP